MGYTRRFNRPTNLEPHDRVWLVVEGVDARGLVGSIVSILGAIDGYALPAEWDITEFLQPSGIVLIEVEVPPTGVGHATANSTRPRVARRRTDRRGAAGDSPAVFIAGLSIHWQPAPRRNCRSPGASKDLNLTMDSISS